MAASVVGASNAARTLLTRLAAAAGLAVLITFGVACGGGSDDDTISEREASETVSRYIQTTLGLFTGATEPQAFVDLFAPECREGVDAETLTFLILFIQAFAPEIQGIEIEEVDLGDLVLEETAEGALVAPRDASAMRLKVDGVFLPASDVFAEAGFEPLEQEDVEEPVLLVKQDGKVYLGDCSELEEMTSGF